MEAINHWTLPCSELACFATEKGFANQLTILEGGESFIFLLRQKNKFKNNSFRRFTLSGLFSSVFLE